MMVHPSQLTLMRLRYLWACCCSAGGQGTGISEGTAAVLQHRGAAAPTR